MTYKIALIFDTAEARDALGSGLKHQIDGSVSAHVGDARQLGVVMQQEQPDVVLLAMPATDDAAFEQIEAATMRMPGVMVLLVSPDSSMLTLKRAMRAGVRDVLPAPMDAQTVQQAASYLRETRAINARVVDKSGPLHAFISAKGGSGCTFLATNLAHQLSTTGKRVLLIDLNLYFGEAATYLSDRKAEASVVDLARQSHRLDAALLEASVLKTHEGLHVLAAPQLPYQLESVTPEAVATVIGLARREYDFVLLDLGRYLNPVTVKALDLADRVQLVMGQTLPALNDAKRMTQVFDGLDYASEKVQLVLNRYARSSPVPLCEVENALQRKVSRTVPASDEAVLASINQGVPLAQLAPRDPVARALQDWAQALAPVALKPPRPRWLPQFARGF
jgi:pilus assembly protein CpaE